MCTWRIRKRRPILLNVRNFRSKRGSQFCQGLAKEFPLSVNFIRARIVQFKIGEEAFVHLKSNQSFHLFLKKEMDYARQKKQAKMDEEMDSGDNEMDYSCDNEMDYSCDTSKFRRLIKRGRL